MGHRVKPGGDDEKVVIAGLVPANIREMLSL